MILFIEIVILLIVITIVDLIGLKRHSLQGLHNLPINIQKRVRELPVYKNKVKGEILSSKERMIKKIPALILVMILFAFLTYLAGARDFIHGFLYSYIIACSIKLYVTFILQCVVLVKNKQFWLPGTEDLIEDWTNRKFYLSSLPRSLFVFGIVSFFIGLMIMMAV